MSAKYFLPDRFPFGTSQPGNFSMWLKAPFAKGFCISESRGNPRLQPKDKK
jgi:hypothetical protein